MITYTELQTLYKKTKKEEGYGDLSKDKDSNKWYDDFKSKPHHQRMQMIDHKDTPRKFIEMLTLNGHPQIALKAKVKLKSMNSSL